MTKKRSPLYDESALLPDKTNVQDEPKETVYMCPLTQRKCNADVCNFAHFELGCFFPTAIDLYDDMGKILHSINETLKRIAVALENKNRRIL